jgi:hypothetical protein
MDQTVDQREKEREDLMAVEQRYEIYLAMLRLTDRSID